jgi:glycosyltransferase involved in cell wall biosynthesis
MRRLTILSVAFPLALVSPDAVGGAEQILSQIDQGLVSRGHYSLVVACPESKVAGTLISTRSVQQRVTDDEWHIAHEATRNAISHALDRYPVELIHMHGIDFADYLPLQDVPVLATLHLPLSWYSKDVLGCSRPSTFMNCVSRSQRALLPTDTRFLPDIENGVPSDLLQSTGSIRKREFAISLGRICPEKGFHLALRAAKRAGVALLLSGRVFPFETHQHYFAEQIVPELDALRRFVGPITLRRKRRLLSAAKCLIAPSLVPETSSLVAREALACGTPVVAFDGGALRDVICHGKTGFIVRHENELADAIKACGSLDPDDCRNTARERFSSDRMVENYLASYQQILGAA